jgi:hypothetical protein
MRLEIGPGGKIIGTKRVSPNGQVSGLSDFAGREVLIVLMEDASSAGPAPFGSSTEWSGAVNEQMRRAFEQYQSLQELYATPWEATRAFLQSVFPWAPLPDITDQVNRWIESQVSHTSRNAATPTDGGRPSTKSSKARPTDGSQKRETSRKAAAGRRGRSAE